MTSRAKSIRWLAFLLLLVITVVGLSSLFKGDWRSSLDYWRGEGWVLAFAFLLQTVNLAIDAVLWRYILARFGIHLSWVEGFLIYFAGLAGLLLPVQLGRFIRSDTIYRIGRGPLMIALRAEVAFLVICAVAGVGVVAASLLGMAWWPASFPITLILVDLAGLAVIRFSIGWFPRIKAKLTMPPAFWLHRSTCLITLLVSGAWSLNGLSLFFVMHDLPGDVHVMPALFAAPVSMLAGTGAGIPGGVGVVEGVLGLLLRFLNVPPTQLVLAIGIFRLITFWIWIPLGWLALTVANRFGSPSTPSDTSSAS